MPLDRVNGEVLDGLAGSMHVVVDARSLSEMTNLLVAYQAPGKFRSVTRHRPLFDDAVAHAIQAFADAGAMRPIRFDETSVLVQVYPHDNKLAVVFQRQIGLESEPRYVTRQYDVPRAVIETLLNAAGKKMPSLH